MIMIIKLIIIIIIITIIIIVIIIGVNLYTYDITVDNIEALLVALLNLVYKNYS